MFYADLYSEEEISEYISKHKNLIVTTDEVLKFWRKRNWKTKSGGYVKTLEAAISSFNGVKLTAERRKAKKQKKVEKKTKKSQPKIIKTKPFELYNEQLKRNEWKKFREFIFAVRGKKCEKCGASTNLQVHHLHYISGRLAWEYLPFDVMVLCGDCHKKIHGIK